METRRECCMCGDYGLYEELFHCKVCLFRSQHRYCSNLYPKAESYRVCNWCLSLEQEKAATSNSSGSSSMSSKSGHRDIERTGTSPKPRGSDRRASPERAARKRIITRRELEERLRRNRPAVHQEMSKQKQHGGFKNSKVRRYKLLDEVSS